MMLVFPDGRPVPGRKAHGLGCHILDEDWEVGPDSDLVGTEYAPVAVEEVPQGTKPCQYCGGGALRRWQAGARAPMTGLRLDGIVRVSKTGDRDTLRSPEQQERDIRRWAKEHGHEIVHVHVAVDQTGRKRNGHPAIEAAKGRALAGVVDGVVAAYVSRFTRNTMYGLQTVAELLDAGKQFFAPECPFDLRTPEGRKYLTGLLAEAEYEGDVKARHFARGVEDAIERGAHLAAPYGLAKGNGKAQRLTVVEAEAKQVKRAFALRAEGFSWPAIAEQLNASGATPRPYKRDGKVMQAGWTHKTVRQLVVGKGPKGEWSVYLGMAFNGEHCVEDAHPAIVTPELFAAANDAKGVKPVGPDEGYLLTGLVRCKGCGYAMAYNGPDFVRCRSAQHGEGRCPQQAACRTTGPDGLEAIVWARFEDEFLGDGQSEAIEDDGRVAAARERLAVAKAASAKAMKLFTLTTTDSEEREAEAQVRAAGVELRDAEDALAQATAQARGSRLPARLTIEEAREAPIPERRHWLSLVYAGVTVRQRQGWREPVADRSVVVPVDGAPRDRTGLRGFVTA
ncbi:MAG TPA: recombinase family protein [Solirubrobacteraceae bacterium]